MGADPSMQPGASDPEKLRAMSPDISLSPDGHRTSNGQRDGQRDGTSHPADTSYLSDSYPVVDTRPPMRNISLYTAASESDLNHGNQGSPSQFGDLFQNCRGAEAQLKEYFRQVLLYAGFGTVFLIVLGISAVLDGVYSSALAYTFLAAAVGISGYVGVRHREWRFLLGFLIASFILVAFMLAKAILGVIILIARANMSDEELKGLNVSNRGWMIASGVVEILMLLLFALFWGFAGYYAERSIRMLLENQLVQQQTAAGGNVHVVGHQAYQASTDTEAGWVPGGVETPRKSMDIDALPTVGHSNSTDLSFNRRPAE